MKIPIELLQEISYDLYILLFNAVQIYILWCVGVSVLALRRGSSRGFTPQSTLQRSPLIGGWLPGAGRHLIGIRTLSEPT